MVVKRFLSIALAGFMVVTSINTGSVRAYASGPDPDGITITDLEETTDYLGAEESGDIVVEDQQEEEIVIDEPSETDDIIASDIEEEVFVTLNARGGLFENEEETLELKTQNGGRLTESIDPPVKDGYKFDGWFLDEELTKEVDLRTYIFTENSVLYAAWQKLSTGEEEAEDIEEPTPDADDYSFTLDANGGKFPDGNETIEYTNSYEYVDINKAEYKPTKKGKLFIGWYADKECKTLLSWSDDPSGTDYNLYSLQKNPENGSTIYAGWVDAVTITYVFGTETGTDPRKDTGYYWDYSKKEKVKQVQFVVPVNTAPGVSSNYCPNSYYSRNSNFHYASDGKWYSDKDRENEVDLESDACKAVEDVTYYAGYKEMYYLVTLHSIDTTGYFTLPNSNYDGEVGEYETMVMPVEKDGYNKKVWLYKEDSKIQNTDAKRGIEGYYFDKEGNNKAVEFGEDDYYKTLEIDKDTDLYVKFADMKNVITFDANGGFIYDSSKPEDRSKKVNQQGFKPDAYVNIQTVHVKNTDLHKRFKGWSTDSKAEEPEFEASGDSDCVYSMFNTLTGDVTYYAIWEDKYHVITLDAGEGTFSYTDPLTSLKVENAQKAVVRTDGNGYIPYNTYITEPKYKNDTKVFSAWAKDQEKIKNTNLTSKSFSEDSTLTAEYTPVYTITFNSGAGKFSYYDENNKLIENVTSAEFKTNGEGKLTKYPYDVVPSDSNSLFEAWYDGDRKISYISEEVFTQNTTLTAKFVKIHSITLNAGKGTFSYYDRENDKHVENATTAVLKTGRDSKLVDRPYDEKATEAGKIFAGWSIDGEIIDLDAYTFSADTIVTAKYNDIYTITVDGDGGTFGYYDRESRESVDDAKTATFITGKDGKIRGYIRKNPKYADGSKLFSGWYIKDTDIKIEDLDEYEFTANTTVVARYVPILTITFDGNGGTFTYYDYSDGGQGKVENAKIATLKTEADGTIDGSVEDPVISDANKTFGGWYIKDTNTRIDYFYDYVFTKDTTIVARYVDVYTITIKGNGGTFNYRDYSAKDSKTVEGATEAVLKTGSEGKIDGWVSDPVISGNQVFEGWYIGDTKITGIDSYVFTKDSTVIAHYSKSYTVKLNANGGYFKVSGEEVQTKEIKIIQGKSKTLDTPKNKEDKTFAGWFYEKECKNQVGSNDFTPTGDIELFAGWLNKYTVTFDCGEGTIEGESSKKYRVTEKKKFGESEDMPSDPVSKESGRVFQAWYDKDGNRLTSNDILEYVVTGDVTFTAKYVNSYTVTFDVGTNKGSFVSKTGPTWSVKVAQGEAIKSKAPTVVSTETKVFKGWFTKAEGGDEIKNIYSHKVESNTTLYAQFTECYKITFHANKDGALLDGSKKDVTVLITKGTAYRYGAPGEAKDILFEGPKMDYSKVSGFVPWIYNTSSNAVGWTENADGTGDIYYFSQYYHYRIKEDGTSYRYNMYGFVPTGDMEFYAKWSTPVKVTFDPNGGTFENWDWDDDQYGKLNDKGQRVKVIPSGIKFTNIDKPGSYMMKTKPEGMDQCDFSYSDSACTNQYKYNDVITKDIIVYAKWSKSSGGSSGEDTSPKITFHAGEGYFDSITKKEIKSSYSLNSRMSTSIPSIDDDTLAFSGWYYDKECKKPYPADLQHWDSGSWHVVFKKEKVDDLYAKYDKTYVVKLDANGGYFDDDDDRTKDPDEQKRDRSVLSAKPKTTSYGIIISDFTKRIRRDGDKIFEGWYTDSDLKTRANIIATDSSYEYFVPTKANTTLYAKWISYVKPTSIKPKDTSVKLDKIGDTYKLQAEVLPSEAATQDVHWYVNSTSFDENARASNPYGIDPVILGIDGTVTAQASGIAKVYAEVNGVRSDLVTITVPSSGKVETSIKVSPETLNLTVDQEASVSAIVTPSSKSDSVTWSSSDKKVATVTGSGSSATIKGVAKGTATITAKVDNKTATVKVTVTETKAPITLSETSVTLTADPSTKREITATLSDEYKNKKVLWKSTDSALVDVKADSSDSTKAVLDPVDEIDEAKEAVITATIEGTTLSATCTVTVRPAGGAEAPVADVPSGSVVKKGTLVTLTTQTLGADIFYTVDGKTDPATTEDGTTKKYTDAIEINADVTMTIKAIAYKEGLKASPVSTFVYTINQDWGDVDSAWFDGKYDEVPDDVWYLIGGKVYKTHGAIEYKPTYNGDKIAFNDKVLVFHHTRKLVESRDYALTFSKNTNAGTGKLNIKGKGVYTSNAAFTFTIEQEDIKNAVITSETLVSVIAGKTKLSSIKPTLTYNGKALKANKDYTFTYSAEASTVLSNPSNPYTISISGKGNFKGELKDAITVETLAKDNNIVAVSTLKVGAYSRNYNGKAVDVAELSKAVTVTNKNKETLKYGEDYEIKLIEEDNTSAGKHRFRVQGIKKEGKVSYIGQKTCTYEIKGFDLKKAKVTGLKTSVSYTGKPITEAELGTIQLSSGDTKIEKEYYTVIADNTGAVGKFNVIFTGKNGAFGTLKKTVSIKAYKVPADKLKVTVNDGKDVSFVKTGAKPSVTVKLDGTTLIEGSDYKVTYKNNKKVGKASVVIKGLANYAGTSKTQNFNIVKAGVTQVKVVAKDVVYNAKGKAGYFFAKPKLMDDGKAVTVGKNKEIELLSDYTYTYYDTGVPVGKKDKIPAGTTIVVSVKVKCPSNSSYTSASSGTELVGQYRVVKSDLSKAKITVNDKDKLVVNNGEAVKLTKKDLTVVVGGYPLKAEDYDIVSITNNRLIGTATLTIRGNGNYGGTKSTTFKIKARKLK